MKKQLYKIDINTIIDLYAEREHLRLENKINKLRGSK